MRAVTRLREGLRSGLAGIHRKREAAVFAAVGGAFTASHVSLTALGRAMPGTPKHGIKRIDRLLGNPGLEKDRVVFYRALASFLLRGVARPVILVDWTPITAESYALVAAARVDGRSVPLFAQIHPRGTDGNPAVEGPFLKALRTVLPEGSTPIIVSDAGFRTAWMKRIRSYGWHFIVRLRGAMSVKLPHADWISGATLRADAKKRARRIDDCLVAKSSPTPASVVLWDGRSSHARRSRPKARRARAEAKAVQARESWALATSLQCSAREVVSIYRSRMQIEEMFRDAKSGRFGFGLRLTLSSKPQRLEALFLLTTLALVAALLVGMAAYRKQLHRAFQANTRTQRVLSLPRLGVLILRRSSHESFDELDVHNMQQRISSA